MSFSVNREKYYTTDIKCFTVISLCFTLSVNPGKPVKWNDDWSACAAGDMLDTVAYLFEMLFTIDGDLMKDCYIALLPSTLKVPIMTVADNSLEYFFIVFQRK